MIKRTLLTMMTILLMLGACAISTTEPEIEGAFVRHLLPAAVRLDILHDLGGKKFQMRGSGTIVHRVLDKGGVYYTYYVLSCGHLYYNPSITKIKVKIRQFDHRGIVTMRIFDATDTWVYHVKQMDISVVKFKSVLLFKPVPLASHIPSDLFGQKAMVMGCPFGQAPLVTFGNFGINHPVTDTMNFIGMRLWVAGGNSGSGTYLFNRQTKRWELMGIVIAYYGNENDRHGQCSLALRLDAIRELLRKEGMTHLIGE